MEIDDVNEIIDCLPKGRTMFYYFKDRYALMLLRLLFDGEIDKHALRGTPYARLLEKELVKNALRRDGRTIAVDMLDAFWPREFECYLLTVDEWRFRKRTLSQTSRVGSNLVLQLNFSTKHEEQYAKLIAPDRLGPFEYEGHPICMDDRRTLAWSRLDIDLESGEALIEEIQADWFRYARFARRVARRVKGSFVMYGTSMRSTDVIRYCDTVLSRHARLWDEAMLAATIWFLRRELGIRKIWYHTWESGSMLKRIRSRQPPRSVYTTLPRKFCFAETREHPEFLSAHYQKGKARRLLEQARFQVLE